MNWNSPGGLARSGVQDPATRAQRGPCGERVFAVSPMGATYFSFTSATAREISSSDK